ncbi:MAG: aspartyl/glutamyl-tRNA(Asn/Gln) amidotransferase subunit B, aspartyl-tRNA(Asn)/glutamyl-tRNA (Gln) amidotransferase subunit B [Parcubacteria group bacterium GW2011_GWC1_45_14]|nr:MAG: aspartyl/glutamyl-tRNA(Asn/Gln) amidotransferase subunit B, aspartyl-tRNA(Asn)/glutamyl-tRNA (Gln) amidotransferase subunit B [Parcubacteria group bacterium GW2011_GWC1_45_14]
MSKYIPVIGMEVHVELKTESKMFCDSKNGMGLETEPNVNICPVCTAQPGTLPVPNRKAIEFVQLAGLALNCELNLKSKFDRKNYFYPDIPKGYQISQYDQPLCGKGRIKVGGKTIGITRIHIEEDTGKLVHAAGGADPVKADKSAHGAGYSLVDFNRAGVPLMELVTEPDIESGAEARAFCQKLQQICRYLGISDADMERGHMRCEVNLSLHKEGEEKLSGTKVEVKNINSFRYVEKAINFEIERQAALLDSGEKIVQETRGWDSVKNETVSQRKKESAHDYRYFPEPDIPPMEFTEEYVEELRLRLPELPDEKEKRFIEQFGLPQETVATLISDKGVADYFEAVVSELQEKISGKEISAPEEKVFKLAVNYILTELRKHMMEDELDIEDIKITPENYAELIGIVADGKINSSAAQTVLLEMYQTGGDPSQIIEEKNLLQVSDSSELEGVVDAVLAANQKSVEDFKAGKENAIKFLMGQVMSASKGKANPQVIMQLLKEKLSK